MKPGPLPIVALFALLPPLACSSSDGDDAAPSGGSAGASGSGEPASGGDGGDSSAGEPGMPSGAAGGSPQAAACGADDDTNESCGSAGDLCSSADRCCRCLDFPGAPSCGTLWDCAYPELNGEACPEAPPAAGAPCSDINLTCVYCRIDGPLRLHCGRIEVASEEGQWNEGGGLSCNE